MSELRRLIERVRDEGHATVSMDSLHLFDEMQQATRRPVRDERGRVVGWEQLTAEEFFGYLGIRVRVKHSTGSYLDSVELTLATGQLEGRLM